MQITHEVREVPIWMASLLSVGAISAVALVGLATLSLGDVQIRRLATILFSFAVGSLLGDAFLHLVPESFEARHAGPLGPSLLVLTGMLLFFVVEKAAER